jgi:branched-chain amino acid transport system ATP-binding protein
LELARCLASDPKLLLLDEPSSGLSEVETHAFGELLRDLADEGRAILMVEHDMGLVMTVCHTIRVLDFGKVIADGTPAEVRGNPLVQHAYLGYSDETDTETDTETDIETDQTLVLPPVPVDGAFR